MNKSEKILNQMAQNFATKVAQLEGEKAILQIELQDLQERIKELEAAG